jgi:hypothetical protein
MTDDKKTGTKKKAVAALPAIRPMVAGIDIGASQHWVCGPEREDGEPNVRVFGTTTPELNELADWLAAQGVTSAAMESTYVYWIPLYELLESRGIEPVLVNARQLHNVPGRKTAFSDCQWLQQLHSCGLLRGSFRPTESITRLRALQRQMANLVAERARCVQWMQKALDQMNVQVHRAVTDLTGKTGMAIVRAIVAGERDPLRLAAHRDRRCGKSVEDLARHLTGTWRVLAPTVPAHPDLGRQAAQKASQQHGRQPNCRRASHGRALGAALQDGARRGLPAHRTPQGRRRRGRRDRAAARRAHLPHAALRPRLRGYRREGV